MLNVNITGEYIEKLQTTLKAISLFLGDRFESKNPKRE